jgi:hypothetical protein
MLSRGQILLSIEHLIQEADAHIANLSFDWEKARANIPIPKGKDPQQWNEYLKQGFSPMLPPTGYLPGFLDKVKRVLVDVGTAGGASVRRLAAVGVPPFVHKSGAEPWAANEESTNRGITLLRQVKAELERTRAKMLGTKPGPAVLSRPSPRGRPRDRHINEALRMLREGIRQHRKDHLNPRERWERVFNSVVVPYFEKNVWPSMEGWTCTGQEKKKAEKNLRNALRGRGGVGIPPSRKMHGK